jgi:4-hydroxy-2-oxoheptanedioate aldolase
MPTNMIKDKISKGEPVIGIWSIIPSPILAEIVGLAGMDFQIFDMEHGVYDLQTLDNNIRACESVGCSPIVRVPGVNLFAIQSALDLGAHGIIVPQVISYEMASAAVRCTKYYPEGNRGFNPFTRGGRYTPLEPDNSKLTNGFGLSSLIIENVEAYKELDKILTISELDMVYLGVYDMSVSLGCKGDVTNQRVNEFVETSIGKILDAGKAVGLMVNNKNDMEKYIKLGVAFLVYSVDTFVIHQVMAQAVDTFKLANNRR